MPMSAVEAQFKTWKRYLATHQTTNLFFLKNTGLLPRMFQFRDYFNSHNKTNVQIIDLDAENISTNYDFEERLKTVSTHMIILARSRFLQPESVRIEPILAQYHTRSPYRIILVHECAPHELYTTYNRASVLYVKPTLYKLPTDNVDLVVYVKGVLKLWNMQMSEQQIEACISYCGNIAWLINEYIRLQSEYPKYESLQITQSPTMQYRVKAIFDSLPTSFKEYWHHISTDPQVIKEIYDSGLVDSEGIPIGKHLIDSISRYDLELLQTTPSKIIFNQIDCSNNFSPGELRLIDLFNKTIDPISREIVGATLYNSKDIDYSDWALSQSISRLRTKLNKQKIPLHISPKRGIGYVSTRN